MSCYLLDLLYSLCACIIFVCNLFNQHIGEKLWQINEIDKNFNWNKHQLMTIAPISTNGKKEQFILTSVVLLSHEFWALIIAQLGWYLVSNTIIRKIMATWWVNVIFRLGLLWFGRTSKKSPDISTDSRFK